MPNIKPNINRLVELARYYDKATVLMKETIELYKSRYIYRVETAEKLIGQLKRKNANINSIRQKLNAYRYVLPLTGILERKHQEAEANKVILKPVSSSSALNGRVRRQTFTQVRVGANAALSREKKYTTAILKAVMQLPPW